MPEGCHDLAEFLHKDNWDDDLKAAAFSAVEKGCVEYHDPHNCAHYARKLEHGLGVPVDLGEAARFYRISCDGGEPLGCFEIAFLQFSCANDDGTDFTRCFPSILAHKYSLLTNRTKNNHTLLKEYCDNGSTWDCLNLGYLHETGAGVEKNVPEANRLYTYGCNRNNAHACSHLAYLFETGLSVSKNLAFARSLYERACTGGDNEGCGTLSKMLLTGEGGAPDTERGLGLLFQSCDRGDGRTCAILGKFHVQGWMVDKSIDEAILRYRQSCDASIAISCADLSDLYDSRSNDEDDATLSIFFKKRACDLGHTESCDLYED